MLKLPSGAEWGQFSLQPKINSAKLFVKNLKTPSAKGAVTSSNQQSPISFNKENAKQ
jgi:hypothetical protein